jgi:hypothetical protein
MIAYGDFVKRPEDDREMYEISDTFRARYYVSDVSLLTPQ